jgi:outer membrane protein OmpA-like peptidoglycan-associated protein
MAEEEHGSTTARNTGHGGGHHGPSAPHEDHHEGAPEWLISFADNVILQLGFFVILLAVTLRSGKAGSSPERSGDMPGAPPAAQLDFALAVREAFNNPVNPESTDPRDYWLVRRLKARRGQSEARSEGLQGAEHDVRSIRPSDYFGLGGAVFFETDSAELNDAGRQTLEELARYLRGYRTRIEIRGHASAQEAFSRPDRGMALSYERARAVATALVELGLPWERLHLIACADTDRVVLRADDPQGHQQNQRVEIIVTQEVPPVFE